MSSYSCVPHCSLVEAVGDLTRELRSFKNLSFPLSKPLGKAIGKTYAKEEFMGKMLYRQELGSLPPAQGRDKDIKEGVFQVVVEGGETTDFVVSYDLVTRQPLSPVEWSAEKGSVVTLRLAYRDDDGNLSDYMGFAFGLVRDTIPPNAPEGIGRTVVIGESSPPTGAGEAVQDLHSS